MALNDMKVDLSRIPDGDMKSTIVDFATKYNALVDVVDESKQDMVAITGSTPEEKAATIEAVGRLRGTLMYLHSKRFSVAIFTATAYSLLGILRSVGVTPVQVGHFFDDLLKILDKLAQ